MATAAEIRRQMEARKAREAAEDAKAKAKAPAKPAPKPSEDEGLFSGFKAMVERRHNDVEETAEGKTKTRKYR